MFKNVTFILCLIFSVFAHAEDQDYMQKLAYKVSDYHKKVMSYKSYVESNKDKNMIPRIMTDKKLSQMLFDLTTENNLKPFTNREDALILKYLGHEIIQLQELYIQQNMDKISENEHDYPKKIVTLRSENELLYFEELSLIENLLFAYMGRVSVLTEKMEKNISSPNSETLRGTEMIRDTVLRIYLQVPVFLNDKKRPEKLKAHYLNMIYKHNQDLLKVLPMKTRQLLSIEIHSLIKKYPMYQNVLVKIFDGIVLADCEYLCQRPSSLEFNSVKKRNLLEYNMYR